MKPIVCSDYSRPTGDRRETGRDAETSSRSTAPNTCRRIRWNEISACRIDVRERNLCSDEFVKPAAWNCRSRWGNESGSSSSNSHFDGLNVFVGPIDRHELRQINMSDSAMTQTRPIVVAFDKKMKTFDSRRKTDRKRNSSNTSDKFHWLTNRSADFPRRLTSTFRCKTDRTVGNTRGWCRRRRRIRSTWTRTFDFRDRKSRKTFERAGSTWTWRSTWRFCE